MAECNNHSMNDDIQQKIVERLGERKRKLDSIEAWERASRKRRISFYTVVSVAASLLLVLLLNPFAATGVDVYDELGIMQPSFGSYRASVNDIAEVERLIDEGNVYEALDLVEKLLKASEHRIKHSEKNAMPDDEEWIYEQQSEKMLNAELRWNYIYLLIVLECENTAVRELKRYISNEEFCVHRTDAEKLLKALD